MEGRYKCECQLGWEGYNCEIDSNECAIQPCQNDGVCIQGQTAGSFECRCVSGYTGQLCQEKIAWCSNNESNPCKNEAKCIRMDSRYKCLCENGFEGLHCDTNTNDCKQHKCKSGSTCIDSISNYTCKCKEGYTGFYCETLLKPIALPLMGSSQNHGLTLLNKQTKALQQNIACPINDCVNGGLCYRALIDGKFETEKKCKCSLGYSGNKCEILHMVNYQYDDSYLEFESPDFEYQFNLTFKLMTTAEQGIVFYHGSKSKQHMAVELFKGRLRISYDIGNAPVSTMFSYAKINDGEERNVQFIVKGQNFTLKISETNEVRSISNEGKFEYLNVGFNEPLYLGGVPNSVKERIAKELLHVRNSSSLKGCISNVYVNSQLKNLQQIEYSHKMSPGCTFKEACFKNKNSLQKKCKNDGICKPLFSLNSDHVCECSKEFTGSSCEFPINLSVAGVQHRALHLQGIESILNTNNNLSIDRHTKLKDGPKKSNCVENVMKDFYVDVQTGCRSKRKIKSLKCKSECESQTKSVKQRPFSFIIGTNKHILGRSLNARNADLTKSCCQASRVKRRNIRLFCADGSTMLTEISIVKRCTCSNQCSNMSTMENVNKLRMLRHSYYVHD